MHSVKAETKKLLAELPSEVRLVAVSKYYPKEYIEEAYSVGQRVFGESNVQELRLKQSALPDDIEWHFIGHLQTNKVKYIAPFISLIHSVDSERLVAEIDRQAKRFGRVVDILLELHIAQEDTKTGLTLDECNALLESDIKNRYPNVRVRGIMMMASNVDDERQIEQEFHKASEYFDFVKSRFFSNDDYFTERSWGMSDDYELAIRQRSTMIRVGTKLFGTREA